MAATARVRVLAAAVLAMLVATGLVAGSSRVAQAAAGDVTTYLGDNGRSSFNPAETVITPSTAGNLSPTPTWTATGTGSYVSSQPVVANGVAYWGDMNGYEHATNTGTGAELWNRYLGSFVPDGGLNNPCTPDKMGVGSAATVGLIGSRAVVFVAGGGFPNGTSGQVSYWALDAMTGAVVWQTPLAQPPNEVFWSSSALYSGSIFVGLSSNGDCPVISQGKLFKLNAATGALTTTFKVVPDGCIGGGVWGSPTIDTADGSVYIATGNTDPNGCTGQEPYAQALVKLKASDLSVVSSWQVPDSPVVDHDFGSTPTLFAGGGRSLVGVVNKNGVFYTFDRTNVAGGPVWTYAFADPRNASPESGDGSVAPAAWDGTRLYVAGGFSSSAGNCQGTLQALNPATGALVWKDCLSGPVLPAVDAAPGIVAVGAGSRLMVANSATGATLWSWVEPSGGAWWAAPTIANGTLYAANSGWVLPMPGHSAAPGRLYAFNLTSGGGGGGGTVPPPTAGGWQLNGSASLVGSSLQLTSAAANLAGSAFWPAAVSSSSISVSYDAVLNGGTGADGLALVLADASTAKPTSLGALGGGMGFAGIPGVAVCLDTWQNWNSADPSNNFVGVATGFSGTTDNLTYVATNTTVPNLRAGTNHVVVTVSAGRLQVSVGGVSMLNQAVTLPPNVLIGFSGGTGGNVDIHAVSNVVITAGSPPPPGPGVLSVSPTSLAFGSVATGSTASATFSLSNTGGTALTVSSVTPPAAPFSAPAPLTVGTSVAAGATLTQTVRFSPTATGAATGSYAFAVNDGKGTRTVSLSGTGTAPGSGTVPPPTAGGWQLNGSASLVGSSLQLTSAAANLAGSAFWPAAVSSSSISVSYDAVLNGGTGADGLALVLADASTAKPTSLGALGGGMGFAGIPGVAVCLDTWQNWNSADPSNNFVGVATGFSGTTDNLTYVATNTTVPNLRAGTNHVVVTVSAGRLQVSVGGVSMLNQAVTLPPNVLIGFSGGTGGNVDIHAVSNVVITAGSPPPPGPGVLSVSPTSLAFGSVATGSTASATFSLSNTGGTALTVSSVTPPAAPFSAPAPLTVGTSVAAGATLTQTVRFSPTATGAATGSYAFAVNDGKGTRTVSLSGTGTAPGSGTVPPPTAGGWQLNGSASLVGSSLQLTSAAANLAGSAFWPAAVSSSSISVSYDAVLNGGTGADGLALVLADASTAKPTSLGALGGGMGFAGIPGVAVCLDTWQNWNSADPSNNFVGVATGFSGTTDNLTYVATNTTVPNLRAGTNHVVVTVSAGRLQVSVGGVSMLNQAVTLPPNVLIGFSGGTGGNVDIHAVSNVVITAH